MLNSIGDWIKMGWPDAYGVTSITATQLFDLTILHELAHTKIFGGQNPDNIAVEKKIWGKCIRW
jgi:hypothetical protein